MKKLGGSIPLPRDAEVGCIACGKPLYLLPDSYPLVFHCELGHFMTTQDLIEELLPMGKAPQTSTVEQWHRTSLFVGELAGRALGCGHPLLAADLEEAADRISQWARSLEELLCRCQAAAPCSRTGPDLAGPSPDCSSSD